MTDEEMIAKGMVLRDDGFWRGEAMNNYREGERDE
jgi:hypothetical protein